MHCRVRVDDAPPVSYLQGHLPQRASIPDMISNTAMYIGLQRVFQAKAAADAADFYAIVERVLRVGAAARTMWPV